MCTTPESSTVRAERNANGVRPVYAVRLLSREAERAELLPRDARLGHLWRGARIPLHLDGRGALLRLWHLPKSSDVPFCRGPADVANPSRDGHQPVALRESDPQGRRFRHARSPVRWTPRFWGGERFDHKA